MIYPGVSPLRPSLLPWCVPPSTLTLALVRLFIYRLTLTLALVLLFIYRLTITVTIIVMQFDP